MNLWKLPNLQNLILFPFQFLLIFKKKKSIRVMKKRERLKKKKEGFLYMGCILYGSDSFWLQGLYPARLLCSWNSPGKNTGVCCHSLLQGIFLTQGSNLGLLRFHFFIWGEVNREREREEKERLEFMFFLGFYPCCLTAGLFFCHIFSNMLSLRILPDWSR